MYVFKRILKIFGILILAAVIFAAGDYVLPDYNAVNTPAPLPPPVYIPEEPDPIYTELGAPSAVEYGIPEIIKNNNDPFHAYIRYPQAGNPADEYIYQWAYELFSDMLVNYSTGMEFAPSDFGEMNIQFDSYLIDNRYAGINQYGQYSYGTTEQPREIIKTFNIDLTEFRLLEPGDIFDFENIDSVLSLLSLRLLVEHPRTDGYHVFVDETWLSILYITHEGIKIILPHGEFLPDSFDTLTVTLPYEDLGQSLLIRRDAPLPSMPTPVPDEPPMQDSAPDPDDGDSTDSTDGDGGDGDEEENNDDDDTGSDTETNGSDDTDSDDNNLDDDNINVDSAGDDTDSADDSDGGDDGDPEDGGTTGGEEDELEPVVSPQSNSIDTSKPVIAITFNDGPSEYTDALLDLFEQYNIRATFFTTGNLAHIRSETLMRAVQLKCEVAGLSWNHKNMAKMNTDDARLQIETTTNVIEEITGIRPPFFRPPYRAVSDTMKRVSEELGMAMINWNVDAEDWKDSDADKIYAMVMEQVNDKDIIISQDVHEGTLEAYRRLIPDLLAEGYQLVTVTELLNIEHNQLTAGQVYYNGVKVEIMT